MLLLVFFISIVIVHGQLSVDELFFFKSKYTSSGNCSGFQYIFREFQINSINYNQLIYDCDSSSIILRNQEQTSRSMCPNNNNNFRVHFHQLSQSSIQVNQIYLRGIELCSLDDLIRERYQEYSDYRSQWALLINLENTNTHLAIATDDKMTFIVFLEYDSTLKINEVELIFPTENIFKFNRSLLNVWRIDQGRVRTPNSFPDSNGYQLSKSKFSLFNNETFFLYGTQMLYPRRFLVSIDGVTVTCTYDYILQCTFPILPLNLPDTHRPVLTVVYNRRQIFNTSLTLLPRTRLNHVPTNHSLTKIDTFEVNVDTNLCANESLKSVFTFIVHLWREDANLTVQYERILKNDLDPIDCNTTAQIGQKIKNVTKAVPLDDILTMNVDLTHQWYEHRNCGTEATRIAFT